MVLDTKWENLSHHVKPASRGRHILCMAAGWGRKSFISTVPREKFIYLILLDSKTFTLGLAALWILFYFLWHLVDGWGEIKYVVRKNPPAWQWVLFPALTRWNATQVLPSKWCCWGECGKFVWYRKTFSISLQIKPGYEPHSVQDTEFCLSVTNWSESTGHIRCFLWQGKEMWVSWWQFLHQQSLCFKWARTCRFLWDNFRILQAEWK